MRKKRSAFIAAFLSTALFLSGCNYQENGSTFPADTAMPEVKTTTTAVTTSTDTTSTDTTTTESTAATTTTDTTTTESTAAITTTDATATEATTATTATTPDETITTTDVTTTESEIVNTFGSKEDILKACSTQADCETNFNACRVFVESDHPYDVIYDYGEAYNEYVKACDWSLVFDAEYYKVQFPILALLYHNDDALLLEHFQTVGVHEGRQGSAEFNVGAYRLNSGLKNVFHRDFAAYYIYYMLNYSSEKDINTLTSDDAEKTVYRQYTMVKTILQSTEQSRINAYRSEVGADAVAFDSELAALANLRAYHNAHDGYRAHDWAKNNNDLLCSYFDMICNSWKKFGENNYENFRQLAPTTTNFAEKYKISPPHYECMVRPEYNYVGVSNFYSATGISEQFDVYINGNPSTAMYE